MAVPVSGNTKAALILVGVFGFLAVSLMGFRLAMRKVRGYQFNLSDYLTMVAIFCMFGRTAFATVILLWQNNNMTEAYRASHTFTDQEIYERVVGGKLTLVNRVIYNVYLWTQKSIVLLLYHRLFDGLPRARSIMNVYWVIFFITLVAVQVSCFTECHPLRLYWQVVPDPGKCSEAVVQLYLLIASNIFTDVLLIVLPIPWLLRIKRSLWQRFQLIGLFSIGIALVIIAIGRLPIYGSGTSQVTRNTLGSIEAFFAAFVANVPTLVTLRCRGPATSSVMRTVTNGAISNGTRDLKYARDEFRQIICEDEGILRTDEIEMISRDKTDDDEAYLQGVQLGLDVR